MWRSVHQCLPAVTSLGYRLIIFLVTPGLKSSLMFTSSKYLLHVEPGQKMRTALRRTRWTGLCHMVKFWGSMPGDWGGMQLIWQTRRPISFSSLDAPANSYSQIQSLFLSYSSLILPQVITVPEVMKQSLFFVWLNFGLTKFTYYVLIVFQTLLNTTEKIVFRKCFVTGFNTMLNWINRWELLN